METFTNIVLKYPDAGTMTECSGKCSERMTNFQLSLFGEYFPSHFITGNICNEATFPSVTKFYSLRMQTAECQEYEFRGENNFPFCLFHYV